jgi:hypothetical protein
MSLHCRCAMILYFTCGLRIDYIRVLKNISTTLAYNLWCTIYTMSNLIVVAPNLRMAR